MTVKTLKWKQVNAWRLSQHCLWPHLKRRDQIKAVNRTGGIQAQVMSAAEWALGGRVDGLSPQDVQSALWQDRTLVKTWAMRATLHLLVSNELPLYVAARSVDDPRNWVGFFEYYGISKSQYEAYLRAAPEILGREPMTREQFATALAKHLRVPKLRMISGGWGTSLKPLAWRGDLCFGPSDGRNVTFVNPKKWIGEWQPVEPYEALQTMARRYLRAYGPATVEEFALWWGLRLTPARKLFHSMANELEEVSVEGWRAVALKETLEPMQKSKLSGSVNLLPLFDAYVMGIGRGADIEPLLPREYQRLVYRPQGWISAVVLVDGFINGIWEYEKRGSQTIVRVRVFSPITATVRKGIEAESERLAKFLKTKVAIEYKDY